MLLMMAEVMHLPRLADLWKGSAWEEAGRWIKFHTTHVEWRGCSLHDMIQPSFSFLVGAALLFSMARRKQEQGAASMTLHALWRALVLVLMGVWLRSLASDRTNWTFEDTLTQIGLGYPFLFLLGFTKPVVQWIVFSLLMVGYWMAFALYPLPPAGTAAEWVQSGFAEHWSKNTNAAWAFDQWFLNLFPRGKPFENNGGGYATLSFIPTLGTMILGLLAGGILKSELTNGQRLLRFLALGASGIALGMLFDVTGICPLVKRIWTPSWTLYSGGVCFLMLALFYLIADMWRMRGPMMPLIIIGMNSIAAYLMAHLWEGFISKGLQRHLPVGFFERWGREWQPLFLGACILLVEWLILVWMYRRKIFLKI